MKDIGTLVIGIVISILGIVNMTGNINTVHSYNRKRVKEEDIPKYGRFMGLGTLTVGLGCIASSVLLFLNLEAFMAYAIIPTFAVGIGLILFAQFKYNGGIF